ncbi:MULTISPECIES: protein YgfX [Vitreoscilla]|uniref:Toxin CptA n=1 Tax=Vitreoscilla stercoraria TaxID=61 RepID=A0ABY4EDS6_VITST|nr:MULTISPECIES: protein YgfX [Vitreoscilla]AUZ03989.1 hypothetical protein ADP71_01580 [Vitreoscilla sp. C1]UOO93090.1 hypothetical protein LVJ81_03410 [Vitreoscilla stercoraria]
MPPLHLQPKPSWQCAVALVVLHMVLIWVLVWQWSAWPLYVAVLGVLLSAMISFYQWRRSAAYRLLIAPDGSVHLQWQQQTPIKVMRITGGIISRYLLVVVWQDAQKRRYQTALWPDSVSQKEFKMAFVWLRWQPVPKEESKQ